MTFDLTSYLNEEREKTELALIDCLDAARDVPSWAFPVLRYGVLSGGKRIRPILCVAAYRALAASPFVPGAHSRARTDDREPAVRRLSCAVELIHAYSLMHDDLPCMDDAPLRRGRPTPHTLYGDRTTLRAGALLIPLAARVAWQAALDMGLAQETATGIVNALLHGAGAAGMVGGQWLDLEAEGRALSERELTRVHNLKTGALLTAALEIGALAAQASASELAGVVEYGRAVGLAFQIADDVLDRTASTQSLGKKPSDVELDKSTYVTLLGVDGSRARGRAEVERARTALVDAGIGSAALESLASYILDRDR